MVPGGGIRTIQTVGVRGCCGGDGVRGLWSRARGSPFQHFPYLTKVISVVRARAEHRQEHGSGRLVQGCQVTWV